MSMTRLFFTLLLLTTLPTAGLARGVYQEPAAFIDEVFKGSPPAAKRLWLTGDIKQVATQILGHPPNSLRLRYWGQGHRSAWVLEETGKEKLITVGIVIAQNRIERLKVLVFRESRGWEVRHDFFTKQFNDARLLENKQLHKHIDGISGATLSVRALKKLSRLALYLHTQTEFSHDTP
jgi:hypothetical protein